MVQVEGLGIIKVRGPGDIGCPSSASSPPFGPRRPWRVPAIRTEGFGFRGSGT